MGSGHTGPEKLLKNPSIDERLFRFKPRDVRKLLIGEYEVRYEIRGAGIFILRV